MTDYEFTQKLILTGVPQGTIDHWDSCEFAIAKMSFQAGKLAMQEENLKRAEEREKARKGSFGRSMLKPLFPDSSQGKPLATILPLPEMEGVEDGNT